MSGESESYVPLLRWLFKSTYHYGISGEIRGTKEGRIESAGPGGYGGIQGESVALRIRHLVSGLGLVTHSVSVWLPRPCRTGLC